MINPMFIAMALCGFIFLLSIMMREPLNPLTEKDNISDIPHVCHEGVINPVEIESSDISMTHREYIRLNPPKENQLAEMFIESLGYKSDEFTVTAYCPCQKCTGKYADGKTSTNTNAFSMGVAVDPKTIPLGSQVTILGYGRVIADDVGGGIKGRHIDVRFLTHQEALEWGVQTLTIEWLEEDQL